MSYEEGRFGRTPLLGLSERWSLCRRNAGSPIIVIIQCTLPSGLVNGTDLFQVVETLLATYPMLKCGVKGQRTNAPEYHMNELIKAAQIVSVKAMLDSLADGLVESITDGSSFDAEKGVLWKLQLQQGKNARDRLVLMIDHIICDGVGAKNLFGEILDLLSFACPAVSSIRGNKLPRRLDDMCDLQAALSSPSPRSPLPPNLKAFPGKQPKYDSRSASQQFVTFEIPRDQVSALISEGRKHNVQTFHPLLFMAGLVALYRATLPDSQIYSFGACTPFSHRHEADNPAVTGNYVTFHIEDEHFAPSTRFWDKVREYSAELREPRTKLKAKHALGKFAAFTASPIVEGSQKTGWEEFIDRSVEDVNGSHKMAFVVSNLGVLKLPKEGKLAGKVSELCFAQTASVTAGAFLNSVITAEDGSCIIACGFRVGSTPPGTVERYQTQFTAILESLAKGLIGEDFGVNDDTISCKI